MGNVGAGLISVAAALVGLAALAVIVGKNSKTTDVIASTGNAFANSIQAAEAPVLDSLQIRPYSVGGHG